jgi:hypothetical protein
MIKLNGSAATQLNTQDSGDFTVQVSNNGCLSPFSDIKRIDLLPLPVTSVITGTDTSRKFRMDNYSVINTAGSTYTWTITGGNKVSGGSTANIAVQWNTAGSGNVKVQENGNNGCKGIPQNKSVNVADNTGLNEWQGFGQVSLFPNPASGQVNLRFEYFGNGIATIRFINLLGQKVDEMHVNVKSGLNEFIMNTDGLTRGVYFVEVQMGADKSLNRLIIQR